LWQHRGPCKCTINSPAWTRQLREFAVGLIERVAHQDQELRCKQLKIDQLTHEMAVLRRWKFAARSEQLHGEQRFLFDETVLADLEAIEVVPFV